MRESYRSHQHAIASSLIGIIEIAVESSAFDGVRVLVAGAKSRRQGKWAVVYSTIGNRAQKISADRNRRYRIELPMSGAGRVAVFVISINAAPHVQSRDLEAVARAPAESACAPDPLTENRQVPAVETKIKVGRAGAHFRH